MRHFITIIIVLAIGLLSLTACVPPRQVVQPTTTPDPVEPDMERDAPEASRGEIVERLSHFNARILAEPDEPCPGPDGKTMIHLGRNYQVQFVLEFLGEVPPGVKSDNLIARIDGMDAPFTFIKRMSETEFATARTRLDFLDSDLKIGPSDVSIYYRDQGSETHLGEMGRVVVDTTAPPKPIRVKILKSGADFFEATWALDRAPEAGDVKEIIIKKRDSGAWRSLWSGSPAPPARIPSSPVGQFRIVVVDCALNRTFTDFSPDLIVVTRNGCGATRDRAYKNARQRITKGIFEEHIKPGLKERTGLTTRSWVPPDIIVTPRSQARFYESEGGWCVEVSGHLNRARYNKWFEDLARRLEKRKKQGVRLHARGKGADILAGLFKAEAANRGLAIYDEDDAIDFNPAGKLNISVSLGAPSRLNHTMADIYCWRVRATIDFTSESGQRIYLTQANVEDLDPRIYGSALQDALYNQGPNSFTERVGRPLLKAFFQQFVP